MLEILQGVPRTKAPRTGTVTETLKKMKPGDCIFVAKKQARSIRAMASRYGIRLSSATQEDGRVGFWRV